MCRVKTTGILLKCFDLDVISLYQAGSHGRSILFPVSHLLISLPSEGQSLWANQISSTYLNRWLRYNYFRFSKTNVRHIGNLLSVSISTICPKSAHYSASGCQIFFKIEAPTAEIWRHIHFSRWRPRRLNTTSGFVSVDVTAFRRSKSNSKPNFVETSQMEAEIYFYDNPKWLGKGSKFFSKSKMCQYPVMFCYIWWIQKCVFDACRLSLHNSTPSHCTSKTASHSYHVIHGLSNRAIFSDLEGPQTQISRSGYSLTLNISKMAKDTAIVTMEGK